MNWFRKNWIGHKSRIQNHPQKQFHNSRHFNTAGSIVTSPFLQEGIIIPTTANAIIEMCLK